MVLCLPAMAKLKDLFKLSDKFSNQLRAGFVDQNFPMLTYQ